MKNQKVKSQREKRMLETIQHLNSIKQNVQNYKKANNNKNDDYD